jgi:hypothetical protein
MEVRACRNPVDPQSWTARLTALLEIDTNRYFRHGVVCYSKDYALVRRRTETSSASRDP